MVPRSARLFAFQVTPMRLLSFLAILALHAATSAQEASVSTQGMPGDAAAAKSLRNICMAVSDLARSTREGSGYRYVAIEKLMHASGVTEKDDAALRSQKLQATWTTYRGALVCNSLQFDVQNGSVLKYAVIRNFDAFVYFAAENKLGLTQVDQTDGRTVLDYIADHKKRTGPEMSKTLEQYYQMLRKAGAKHAGELS